MGSGSSSVAAKMSSAAAAAAAAAPSSLVVPAGREVLTAAGGCFWCTEGVFVAVKGVDSVVSGYIGGHDAAPTYEAVCSGSTGHTEAVEVTYNPAVVSYERLLKIFFATHDPTTLNRQGNDRGTQYRSGVYFHSPAQEAAVRAYVAEIAPSFRDPIVTEIMPATKFYRAEEYHQSYYARNPSNGYCRASIPAKIAKAQKVAPDLV